MKKSLAESHTQQLAQVMNALGWNARESRLECAQRIREAVRGLEDKNVSLRIELRRAQKERDEAQVAQVAATTFIEALYRQIHKLAKAQTGEARSPTEALHQETAVWAEFERLRKEWTGEKT